MEPACNDVRLLFDWWRLRSHRPLSEPSSSNENSLQNILSAQLINRSPFNFVEEMYFRELILVAQSVSHQ